MSDISCRRVNVLTTVAVPMSHGHSSGLATATDAALSVPPARRRLSLSWNGTNYLKISIFRWKQSNCLYVLVDFPI